MSAEMGTFRIDIEIENPARPGIRETVRGALVDTGSELSWVPAGILESLGVGRRKMLRFRQASGTILERWVGWGVVYAGGTSTSDDVVFGEPGDMVLLGARTLEGLNLRVDPVTKTLVDAGPAPAAAGAARRLPAILCLLVTATGALDAQTRPWALRTDFSVGLYSTVSELGTIDVTRAKLRTAPSLGVALSAGPKGGRLGVRASAIIGITSGTRFRPTGSCQSGCGAYRIEGGRFLGAALDFTTRLGSAVQFGAGAGMVRYDYGGGQGFVGQCQAGAMCDDPFRSGSTKLAGHWGVSVLRRLSGISLVGSIADFISHRVSGGFQNDLNVAVGIGIGRL